MSSAQTIPTVSCAAEMKVIFANWATLVILTVVSVFWVFSQLPLFLHLFRIRIVDKHSARLDQFLGHGDHSVKMIRCVRELVRLDVQEFQVFQNDLKGKREDACNQSVGTCFLCDLGPPLVVYPDVGNVLNEYFRANVWGVMTQWEYCFHRSNFKTYTSIFFTIQDTASLKKDVSDQERFPISLRFIKFYVS